MKLSKWVDFGQEIEVEIGVDDIRGAMAEHFSRVTDGDIEDIHWREITTMLNIVAQFFKALSDEQIASVSVEARKTVHAFLTDQAKRFAEASHAE